MTTFYTHNTEKVELTVVLQFDDGVYTFPLHFKVLRADDMYVGMQVAVFLPNIDDKNERMKKMIGQGLSVLCARVLECRAGTALYEFYDQVCGHDGEGRGRTGRCWNIPYGAGCVYIPSKEKMFSFELGSRVSIKSNKLNGKIVGYTGQKHFVVNVGENKGDFSMDGLFHKKTCVIVSESEISKE